MRTSDADQISGLGSVADLEAMLARAWDMPFAVATCNGTAAMLATALAIDSRGGDVVSTPWTYGGTLAPFLLLGHGVVFGDVDPTTLTLDPETVARVVSPATRAIVAADVNGVPCDARGLREVADVYGVPLIVDAAQGSGARRGGRPSGWGADAIILSFGPGKGSSAGGEGGAVLVRDRALFERILWFGQHPVRQRRQIGLELDNEFAMNTRIHPGAARAVVDGFGTSLEKTRRRARQREAVIDALNASGLTQLIDYRSLGIEPTLERITAAWARRGAPRRLVGLLRYAGIEADTRSQPVRLVYRQPAFLAQYADRLASPPRCPVAEDQIRRRFEIVLREYVGERRAA